LKSGKNNRSVIEMDPKSSASDSEDATDVTACRERLNKQRRYESVLIRSSETDLFEESRATRLVTKREQSVKIGFSLRRDGRS
jgi:hypothetical protein